MHHAACTAASSHWENRQKQRHLVPPPLPSPPLPPLAPPPLPSRVASWRVGGAASVGKVARDRRSGRPTGSAPGGDGGNGHAESVAAAAGVAAAGPRKSIRPRLVDMHKPLPVLRTEQVGTGVAGRVLVVMHGRMHKTRDPRIRDGTRRVCANLGGDGITGVERRGCARFFVDRSDPVGQEGSVLLCWWVGWWVDCIVRWLIGWLLGWAVVVGWWVR